MAHESPRQSSDDAGKKDGRLEVLVCKYEGSGGSQLEAPETPQVVLGEGNKFGEEDDHLTWFRFPRIRGARTIMG